ncbi:FAD-dependent oxidoreductase [Zunongwangia pacifica]|uniref:FAD-dependent oxidoreductase n=1 Tax=Zunongwangia pacifica TaxID=2911062 RepID=A0A9X1ZT47_9FLAO|nr:FAD-dependent oxidoreductase [Zunongwangia pacifica]MCL6220557.1 FAD-dependent oxidoreductase [Zunongwangia pacifica]
MDKLKKVILGIVLLISSYGMVGMPIHPDDYINLVNKKSYKADVIIYGGTSSAVIAAVQVKKMGKSVILVSPDKHLGGLSSSGLGYTDTGNKAVIGGLSREFYHRIYKYYTQDKSWKWQERDDYGNQGQGTPAIDGENRTMWIFEPHIAEQVFEDLIKEYGIILHREELLDRQNGVEIDHEKIKSFTTLSGSTYKAKVFIDGTYEGDLMAAAGINYHIGRESNETYNEEWNGVQKDIFHHKHNFMDYKISPYKDPKNPLSGLVQGVSEVGPGENGTGDKKVQAYNFRLCLTQVKENLIPFYKPDRYNKNDYELLARLYEAGWNETFNKFDPIPNLKTDTNNHGPFSTDYIGANYEYPDASYERRAEIIKDHENYQQGLLYFMVTDERIPAPIQKEFKKWGYAKDEFEDNNYWPHQIYVREARRMLGKYVMTEHDILGHRKVPKPIGMGSYTMDSHNVQRYITAEGYVQNEGDIGIKAKEPYQIAYGAITPKENECTNLLVPLALSSSHIAFGSIRMEPVFMILGQSAATAAVLAIKEGQPVQEINYENLKNELKKGGQVLSK